MKIGSERMNHWARNLLGFFEVMCGIGVPCMLFVTVGILVGIMSNDAEFMEVCHYVFPRMPDSPGAAAILMLVFCVASVAAMALSARAWHDLRLVFDTSAGKTKASVGPTPFQEENVRLLRSAGRCILISQVANIAFSGMLFAFGDQTRSVTSLYSSIGLLTFGLCIFCLAQFFAYGIQLQLDSDGLV